MNLRVSAKAFDLSDRRAKSLDPRLSGNDVWGGPTFLAMTVWREIGCKRSIVPSNDNIHGWTDMHLPRDPAFAGMTVVVISEQV